MALNDGIIESWLLSLHDKAPGTRNLYASNVGMFADWLGATGRPKAAPGDLLAVTRQDAEAWLGSLRADGLTPATVRSRWIALRSLFGWLHEEEEIGENPMLRVKVARADPDPVRVITRDDQAALLKACEGPSVLDRRDMALFRTMMATGLRRSEVGDLLLADVDLAARVLHVRHGKGDRARFVRIDAATANALDRYKRARARHRMAEIPWLWISNKGRLTPTSIASVLQRRADIAGIGSVHPHMLRHAFAHNYLASGGNEGDLQRLGGWQNADVMRRYGSAMADDRALAAYDSVNVMEGL